MCRKLIIGLIIALTMTVLGASSIGQHRRSRAVSRSNASLSLQEEAEQRAHAFWNSRVTKCGSDYYTYGRPYIYQIRNPRMEMTHSTPTAAARLNGVEYIGSTTYQVGQSRRYSGTTTLWDDPGSWGQWRDSFADIAGIGLNAEIRKEHGRWTLTPVWGNGAKGLTAISCRDGSNPKEYFARLSREALSAADAEMLKDAPNWGIYASERPAIPISMFRFLYWATKNYKFPRVFMGPNDAWLISYGSTGMQSLGLPLSLLARAKKTGLPDWVFFTPSGGWIYQTNVLAYENIPQGLVDALTRLSEDTSAGRALLDDFSIVSISFGPQDSWILIYDDKQSRFNDSTHSYSTVRKFECYCNKEMHEILQGNIDNGMSPSRLIFFPNNGWLLLRGNNGFAGENVPADVYQTLTLAREKAPTISNVVVAPNGAWVITTRNF